MRFAGKIAVVTGAASGIGKAAVLKLAGEGAHVFAADIDEAGGQALAEQSNGKIGFVRCDVTKPSDIDTTLLTPLGGPLPPVINDPDRRVYRGVNPVINPGPPPVYTPDRVEVVYFERPGTYLMMCGILPHFEDGMFGYVNVLPNGGGTGGE